MNHSLPIARRPVVPLLWMGWLVACMAVHLTSGVFAAENSPAAAPAPERTSTAEKARFWALQPIARPAIPSVAHSEWTRNPIDAFVLRALEAKGLQPTPPAERRALIRRVTFDLTGLPPTPAEVESFVHDKSPEALRRVVDRLLDSPQYGVRWGRHWLDVARYADSNGLDENVAYGNAWRYRDYVVNSLNGDKPYNEFLIEQLAGDLLPPTGDLRVKQDRLTALGFLSIGPKLLAEADKMKLEMDIIDEQIETLGRVFLGATLGCARCHDHKFDPIPTEDYYALAAIFKSTHTMDDLATIAKWHEPVVADPVEIEAKEAHDRRMTAQKDAIARFIAEANRPLIEAGKSNAPPANPESFYSAPQKAQLEVLRSELKSLEAKTPDLAVTMGVKDRTNITETLPVHVRGNHLSLGKPVRRGVPRAMLVSTRPPEFAPRESGRLELARWLADPAHPLTARVMVNRVWRWHFGRGLVGSTDNFGQLGERPSHPELLDWLAVAFVESGWSLKTLHRLILNSSVYQISAHLEANLPAADPDNRLLHRFPLRRLEAEAIRDAMLATAGALDLELGGKTIPIKNREFFFDHTSKDRTTYDSPRRAAYLPIVRNHLYDLFEQFDYPDPAVTSGDRATTVVAPQALWVMNSELVRTAAANFARRLFREGGDSVDTRIQVAYSLAFARPPSSQELHQARQFLTQFPASHAAQAEPSELEKWSAFCQALLAANEFLYLH